MHCDHIPQTPTRNHYNRGPEKGDVRRGQAQTSSTLHGRLTATLVLPRSKQIGASVWRRTRVVRRQAAAMAACMQRVDVALDGLETLGLTIERVVHEIAHVVVRQRQCLLMVPLRHEEVEERLGALSIRHERELDDVATAGTRHDLHVW